MMRFARNGQQQEIMAAAVAMSNIGQQQ
jgi:hypothetical protein